MLLWVKRIIRAAIVLAAGYIMGGVVFQQIENLHIGMLAFAFLPFMFGGFFIFAYLLGPWMWGADK